MLALTHSRARVLTVRRLLACGALVGAALVPAAAWATGTLDQQQLHENGNGGDIDAGFSRAQTFTAGLTGSMDQVDLLLQRGSETASPLTVEIRNVDMDAKPGTTVLATASVLASSVPVNAPAFVSIPLAPAAPVEANTQYAIVAHSLTPGTTEYFWYGSSGNPYAGGNSFGTASSPPSPGTWSAIVSVDFAFKTYVTTAQQCDGATPTIVGTPGDDELSGTSGNDVIAGLGGDDEISGKSGNDVICGGDADKLNGSSGSDSLTGGMGSPDVCKGGSGTDSGGTGCEETSSIP